MRRMDDMDELVAWIREQLDEDERVAKAGLKAMGDPPGYPDYQTYTDDDTCAADDFIGHFSSARLLREVEAKRRRLERHRPEARTVACGEAGYAETWLCCVQCSAPYGLLDPPEATEWPCLDIRDDAAIYSDRPGYRSKWRP